MKRKKIQKKKSECEITKRIKNLDFGVWELRKKATIYGNGMRT